MKKLWRAALIASLIAIAFAIIGNALFSRAGDFGIKTDYLAANSPSITYRVLAVESDSPAWRAGIRPGDLLPLASVDHESRVALDYALPGMTARVAVVHGAQMRWVDLVAAPASATLNAGEAILYLVDLCVWLFALSIVVRGWNAPYGPLVATVLTLFVGSHLQGLTWVGNDWLFVAEWWVGAACLLSVLILVAAVLTVRLGGRPNVSFTVVTACLLGIAAFDVVTYPSALFSSLHGAAGPFAELMQVKLSSVAPCFLGALALAIAYGASRGEARRQLTWIFWGFVPYYVAQAIVGLTIWNPPVAGSLPNTVLLIAEIGFRLVYLTLPAALFYGLIVRRTVDIGFVFNRVAVYGALSILLVAIFVLLEYLVNHLFLDSGRVDSLAVQVALALLIGLSARYFHGVVERVVDRLFFAKRHADERALHRLASEAEVYASANALLDRVVVVLDEYTDADGMAVYVADSDGVRLERSSGAQFAASVDPDDPALVSLRRWNEPIDTHDYATAFPGGMLFPMSVRGTLVGVIACRNKRDASAFDPDERSSLSEVARSVGLALHSLRNQRDRDSLADAIRRQSDQLAAAIQNLDAVSRRLNAR